MRLLCVDPGLRGCGVAEFEGYDLKRAAYVKNPVETGRGYDAHRALAVAVNMWSPWQSSVKALIEHPRVYPGSAQQKGDLNDLLDVVAVGAAIGVYFPKPVTVFPSDWKGNVPKDVMTERIRRAITDEERARIEKCPANLMHNVLDAIGIGLWKLGRINKKGIYRD